MNPSFPGSCVKVLSSGATRCARHCPWRFGDTLSDGRDGGGSVYHGIGLRTASRGLFVTRALPLPALTLLAATLSEATQRREVVVAQLVAAPGARQRFR